MSIAVIHVAADQSFAVLTAENLAKRGLEAQAFDASQGSEQFARLDGIDLTVVVMSAQSNESVDLASMIQHIDLRDLPFITIRDGLVLPSEKIKFFVQVGQWLDVDPTNPDQTFDRLAHAILNPDARPTVMDGKTNKGRLRVMLTGALIVCVLGISGALWVLNERQKRIESAALLAAGQREQELLRPNEIPWIFTTNGIQSPITSSADGNQDRFTSSATVNLTVPDYMVGHVVEAVFFEPNGTVVGILDPATFGANQTSVDIPIARASDHLMFCTIFDRAINASERRRQLLIIDPEGVEFELGIVEARLANATDTCMQAASLTFDPETDAALAHQTLLTELYNASNLVTLWKVEPDGIGISIDTLIHGGGEITDKLKMSYRTRKFALIDSVWVEMHNLSGERLTAAGIAKPTGFFVCIETFVPDKSMYLADWAFISNKTPSRFSPLARPMEVSPDPICETLPKNGKVKRLPAPLDISSKTVPSGTSATSLAGIEIGMPLGIALKRASDLIQTPAPDTRREPFDSLVMVHPIHPKQFNLLTEAADKGQIEYLTDLDAGIGIAILPNSTRTTVASVFYAYRPSIDLSKTHPEALRATIIERSLVSAIGQPSHYDGYGDRDANSETHQLRWGKGPAPYCEAKSSPKKAAASSYGLDNSSYSLAIDPTNPPVTACRPHSGYSHNRDFYNESMLLWRIGNQ